MIYVLSRWLVNLSVADNKIRFRFDVLSYTCMFKQKYFKVTITKIKSS